MVEHDRDLGADRVRRDCEPPAPRETFEHLASAGPRGDARRDERPIRDRLSGPQLRRVDRQPVRRARVLGAALDGDPVPPVLLDVDVDAERREHAPVGFPLKRLRVRERPVEVEEDAADHSVHERNVA